MKTDCSSIIRFREFVELKDFKPPTKKEYVRYVRRLADHFHCDPASLSEDQLRQYFLFLRQHKQFSGSAMSIGKAAFQLFFREHLGHADWKVFSELVIRRGAAVAAGALAPGGAARAGLSARGTVPRLSAPDLSLRAARG